MIRLDKLLAHMGYGSRKEVKELEFCNVVIKHEKMSLVVQFEVQQVQYEHCNLQ